MDEELGADAPTITLKDEAGRSLLCYIEKSLEADGSDYLLLQPVDTPIEIFAWEPDEDDDEDGTLVDVDDTEVDKIFVTARAVLAEQDLTLQRTALTLTAKGDLPDADDEDIIELDIGEEDGFNTEEFQQLAGFFHEEQEYVICTPLEPLLFFARLNAAGEPELVSPEDYNQVRSQLEDQLFEDLE